MTDLNELARELERLERLATPWRVRAGNANVLEAASGGWIATFESVYEADLAARLGQNILTITRALRFAALGDKLETALHHIAKDYQFSGAAGIALAALSKIEEARKP